MITFLDALEGGWDLTQTIAPTGLSAVRSAGGATVSWNAIPYNGDDGGYEISYTDGDPLTGVYTVAGTTVNKLATSYPIAGLDPLKTYYFRARTNTPPHDWQQNDLWSDYTAPVLQSVYGCDVQTQIPLTECQALEALYTGMDGPHWNDQSGWMASNQPCAWYGVTCSSGHVTALDLTNNNLTGVLPAALGDLGYLSSLNVSSNQITGPLPDELGSLSLLTNLSLLGNLFSEPFPPVLLSMTQLTKLNLNWNQFSGPIPPELGNLNSLTSLSLADNRFSGPIPLELGDLILLTSLNLGDNQFTGAIPDLSALTALEYLDMQNNQLEGAIPTWLSGMSNLIALNLSGNLLTGSIPTELTTLSQLTSLELSYNQLSGGIPIWSAQQANLYYLDLSHNQLSGSIPAELTNLTGLNYLYLNNNQLTGQIPAWLGDMTWLYSLYLGGNLLSGTIPSELGNLIDLNELDLSNNALSGEIPAELLNLEYCWTLNLSYNALYTSDPTLSEFLDWGGPEWRMTQTVAPTGLQAMIEAGGVTVYWSAIPYDEDEGGYEVSYTDGDPLTGTYTVAGTTVDKETTSYPLTGLDLLKTYYFRVRTHTATHGDQQNDLWSLYATPVTQAIYGCNVQTQIPLTECQALEAFFTATGGLNWTHHSSWTVANLPCSWYGVSCAFDGVINHVTKLNLYSNNLTGSLPSALAGLPQLTLLYLPDNQLSGPLPAELGSLSNLTRLQLNRNQLDGNIPTWLGDLSQLNYLILGNNLFTGTIPSQLGNLSLLEVLDLSHNQLSGAIPSGLSNLSSLYSLYLDNNQLEGSIPVELTLLEQLNTLDLSHNQLTGGIPPELGNFPILITLDLSGNQLTGGIPVELTYLYSLYDLSLAENQLSGPIPAELGNMTGLGFLDLSNNALSGEIPASFVSIEWLSSLDLSNNALTGLIPTELGNLIYLYELDLSNNALSGEIPASFVSMESLSLLDLNYNALTATGQALIAFLDGLDATWQQTQTVMPTNPAFASSGTTITLSWQPIAYTADGGGYEISYTDGDPLTGSYTVAGTTANKTVTSFPLTGLTPGVTYYLKVRAHTPVHGVQQNDLWSDYTEPVSATAGKNDQSITVTTPPPANAPYLSSFTVAATASSGLPVSYSSGSPAVCTNAGAVFTLLSGTGNCQVLIDQSGDGNYNPAPQVSASAVAQKVSATLALGPLTFTYDGAPKPVTVTTNPVGLAGVSVAYNGSAAAPTNAGSYALLASLNNPNYTAANVTGTEVINKAQATIKFGSLTFTYDGAPKPVSVTTTPSGLAGVSVTYAGSATAPSGAGSYALIGSLDNPNYTAANLTGTEVIGKASQTITVTTAPPANAPYLGSFTVAATASSGLPVSYSSGSPAVCSNAGAVFTLLSSAGNCKVLIDQAGNGNYNPAPQVSASATAQKAAQSITFAPLGGKTYGDADFALSATASSGLAVSFTASGACSLVNGKAHITGAGSCTLTASQGGNSNYNPATQVSQTVVVAKASATLTFGPLSFTYDGTPKPVTVTTNPAGLAGVSITYAGSATPPTNVGAYALVGSLNNPNYAAAAIQGTETIQSGQKADQAITFASLPDLTLGAADFDLVATATSGLPVSFTASGACSLVSGNRVHLSGAGQCTITASQVGEGSFNPAPDVQRTFDIAKAAASLKLGTLTFAYNGAPRPVTATTTPAGLAGVSITYGGSATAPTNAGSYEVIAKLNNPNYAAPEVKGTEVIDLAGQSITITQHAPGSAAYQSSFTVAATASSGLPVSYSSGSPSVCANEGPVFTLLSGSGDCVVIYDQAGNQNYLAADQLSEMTQAQKADQVIEITQHAPAIARPNTIFSVAATASSGLDVTFSSSILEVCTNDGPAFTMTGVLGECVVQYDQAGDERYNPAPQVTERLYVVLNAIYMPFMLNGPANDASSGEPEDGGCQPKEGSCLPEQPPRSRLPENSPGKVARQATPAEIWMHREGQKPA